MSNTITIPNARNFSVSVRVQNARAEGYCGRTYPSGSSYGPERVAVIDPEQPAAFIARGGDWIGGGRNWGWLGQFQPGQGWTVAQAAGRDVPADLWAAPECQCWTGPGNCPAH